MKKLSALFSRSALRLAILACIALVVLLLNVAALGKLPEDAWRKTMTLHTLRDAQRLGFAPDSQQFLGFAPDGQTVATLTLTNVKPGTPLMDAMGGPVRIWDVQTGKERLQFAGDWPKIYAVLVSPDQRTLATLSQDGDCGLWDAATARIAATLKSHGRHGANLKFPVTFAPDGQTVAVVPPDRKTLEIRDVPSGGLRTTLSAFEAKSKFQFESGSHVDCHAFAPDGKSIAVAESYTVEDKEKRTPGTITLRSESVVRIRDVASGKVLAETVLKGKEYPDVTWMGFSPDGKELDLDLFDMFRKQDRWNIASGMVQSVPPADLVPLPWNIQAYSGVGSYLNQRPDPRFAKFEKEMVQGIGPDGKTIAVLKLRWETYTTGFAKKPGAPPDELHFLDLDTTRVVSRIAIPPATNHTTLGPDGRSVAFIARNEVEFWALPPRPPWWKPFALAAIPAGLVLLIGLAWQLSPLRVWKRRRELGKSP